MTPPERPVLPVDRRVRARPGLVRLALAPVAAGALVVGLAAPASAAAEPVAVPSTTFTAPLDTAQEVPEPSPSDARGTASFALSQDGTELTFRVLTHGLEGTLAGHVHLGRPGETGPVVATLASFAPIGEEGSQGVDRDGVLAEGTLTDDDVSAQPDRDFDGTLASLLAEMRAGGAYVNVHTEDNRPGEIRGLVVGLPADTGVNGTFDDDDLSVHEESVETLRSAGIANGRSDTAFVPGAPVTRAQTASFLARALHLDTVSPPDAFRDDAGSVHEGAIDALAATGITTGCTPTDFCPDELITRGQLATLLDRALELPDAGEDAFTDDEGDFHEAAIDRVAAAGIALGCTETTFCPGGDVTRGQTASFARRALGLAPTAVANVTEGAGVAGVVRPVEGALEAVRAAVEEDGGPGVVAEVDHAANARSVGLSLVEPTTTLLVGAPAAGTPLMQAEQLAALDLPQKIVVTLVAQDQAVAAFTSPRLVAQRHGIEGQDERLASIETTLEDLVSAGVRDSVIDAGAVLPEVVDEGVGVRLYRSDQSFDDTLARVKADLAAAEGVSLAAEVDHAAAADSAGLELRPTTLLVFGNPRAGTPLMAEQQLAALDLPQKMLVLEAADGATYLAFNDPEYVTARAGIDASAETLAQIRTALETLAAG